MLSAVGVGSPPHLEGECEQGGVALEGKASLRSRRGASAPRRLARRAGPREGGPSTQGVGPLAPGGAFSGSGRGGSVGRGRAGQGRVALANGPGGAVAPHVEQRDARAVPLEHGSIARLNRLEEDTRRGRGCVGEGQEDERALFGRAWLYRRSAWLRWREVVLVPLCWTRVGRGFGRGTREVVRPVQLSSLGYRGGV